MAIFKCKMCGGALDINAGVTVVECEYCGTKQTVPSADNEKKITLFSRANRLRFACEFDKAAGVYESIIADFPEEAEAYWGLVLCKYGIEYVDDPATAKKIPTCHRSSFDSVMDDSNFELVLENADVVARSVYREEAKQIEELRKGIIEVSSKEEPYDIFICYKETNENGDRTVDSVIAQDVYTELVNKDYRVFFSRITLEDKLGQEYEPYIFAALNSAKIMLAFGTDYEYYNAVWVKNEWSRFLQLIAKGEKKTLIPCYKDIDAYDMPKEFAKLQAQDMGKVGAIQDLIRGIEKILPKETAKIETVAIQQSGNNPTVNSLLERVFMFLEDSSWEKADEYCEKVLDIDPKCAKAYLGKLMVDLQINHWEQFENINEVFINNANYKKVIKYADDELCSKLEELADKAERKTEEIYINACKLFEEKTIKSCKKALNLFKSIIKYKDSNLLIEDCEEWIELEKQFAKENEQKRIREEKALEEEKARAKLLPLAKKRNKIAANLFFASTYDTVVFNLFANGPISYVGEGSYYSQWKSYNDLIAIDNDGWQCDVALKSNGTVIIKGASASKYQRSNASYWKGIVAIRSGKIHIVGLKSDGTVVAVGDNKYGQCNTSNWINIIAIETSHAGHTVGLKSDGTVVATGKNDVGQCNVSEWTEIIAIATMDNATLGLKADGTLVSVGDIDIYECNVDDWNGIVSIDCRGSHIIGLKYDGTVVATGRNDYGQCDVEEWSNVVAVSTSIWHTVGLKADGTLIATGRNNFGQCNVSSFKLFDDIDGFVHECEENLLKTKQKIEEERIAKEKQIQIMSERRSKNVCQYCGGEFKKGLFSTKCVNCGKIKDY